jgi:hypothetical protein
VQKLHLNALAAMRIPALCLHRMQAQQAAEAQQSKAKRANTFGLRSGPAPLARSPELPAYDPDDIDEVPGAEAEAAEEQILDQATAPALLPRHPLVTTAENMACHT